MGMNWWQLILAFVVVCGLIYFLFKWMRKLRDRIKIKNEKKQASEEHYFELLKQALEKGDAEEIVRHLFFWYDRFREDHYDATLFDFVAKIGDEELLDLLRETSIKLYRQNKHDQEDIKRTELIRSLSEARTQSTSMLEVEEKESWLEINPK